VPVKCAAKALTIRELAALLGCEQWRARRAVDIVTAGRCPRVGPVRAVSPQLVERVRRYLAEEAAEAAARRGKNR